jgi:PBP1b-binding outer membrane lipoprotein LpoB
MKKTILLLAVALLFVGCGLKKDPFYEDPNTQHIAKETKSNR